jgi:hypothetical protein
LWVKSLSKFENKGLTVEYAKKSIMIWNKYYSNYMDFIKKGRAYLVKYELLIKYPVEEMNKLKEYFRLEKKELTYAFEKKKMRPNDDSTIGCTHNFLFQNSDYYREESKYIPQLLSKEIIDVINEELDKSLMEFYGYDYFYHE